MPANKTITPKRYRLKKTVTDDQLVDCALISAATFGGLRTESFELDEIRPGFPTIFPQPVSTGTIRNSKAMALNGYRIPLEFCKEISTKAPNAHK